MAHLSREGQDLARDAIGERLPCGPHGRHRRRAAHHDLRAGIAQRQSGRQGCQSCIVDQPVGPSTFRLADRVSFGDRSAHIVEKNTGCEPCQDPSKLRSVLLHKLTKTNLLAGTDDGVAALRVGVHGGIRHAAHAVVVRNAVRGGLLFATRRISRFASVNGCSDGSQRLDHLHIARREFKSPVMADAYVEQHIC